MHSSESSATESRKKMRLIDEAAEELSTDEVAIIFSFLTPIDIMFSRVCTTWRDAAKKALVPLNEFEVNSVSKYNAMRVMSTTLPNLQQITLRNLRGPDKYSDGEDPDEEEGRSAVWTSHDIDIISRFTKLRVLKINSAPLNGRYPVLFNFSLLQILSIKHCRYLKWDLEMLEGLPLLKKLNCDNNAHLTGNLANLRVLKDTLEHVQITVCRHVEGNFMDLADFPCLKELDLRCTNVRGDIRDIRGHDFPTLEYLYLPKSVHGGHGYAFQLISDVPSFLNSILLLLQRSPTMFERYSFSLSSAFYWSLSDDSPDWYAWDNVIKSPPPPFRIQFLRAGSRLGWSWCAEVQLPSCEINWLDPEPDSDSSDYGAYIQELQNIKRHIAFFRGYHQPPTVQRSTVDCVKDCLG